MTRLLEARHLTKSFPGGVLATRTSTVLADVSLALASERPMILAVVGESGSGKTTLARLLLGLETPTRGQVLYQGDDLRHMSRTSWQAFRREVQVIFQNPYGVYNPFYRIDHVLTTPLRKFRLASSSAEAHQRIAEALMAVGLRPEETLGRFPHQLSGGQRQRVMVARALLMRPRLIIADEPVSMVDASLRATILQALHALSQERGVSMIYITHDLATAYQISDNIVVLYRGAVVEAGDIELVIKHPRHPYTQLLLASLPLAKAERTWSLTAPAVSARGPDAGTHGCAFAARCPSIMDICHREVPPLFQPHPRRAVACYLYRNAPTLPREDLDTVFTPPGDASGQ